MTEVECLTATTPTKMLRFYQRNTSRRKQLLAACNMCRRVWHIIPKECLRGRYDPNRYYQAIEVVERYVEGHATQDEVRALSLGTGGDFACDAVAVANGLAEWEDGLVTVSVWTSASMAPDTETIFIPWWEDSGPPGLQQSAEQASQCQLLRDMVGNPFRPTTFDPAWRSNRVMQLARQMYETRVFSRMPDLNRALRDAGCREDTVRIHCSEAMEHYRGCWVLDGLLQKDIQAM